MSYGRVVSVHKDRLGSQVTTAVTGDGTTRVISVDSSVVDFDEDGGQLVHQPTGDVYSYSSADADAETITLSAGLPVGKSFAILDTLMVYPKANDAYAQVMIDDDPTDIVSARIPGAIRDQIEEGGREIGQGDALGVLAGSEEWTVTGRLGAESSGGLLFPGFIAPYAGVAPASGVLLFDAWLYCDGASVSRAQFSGLFNVMGTQFGSSSGTTFNLPDLRGRTIFGASSVFSLASNEGAAQADRGPAHVHAISNLGGHTHTIPATSHAGTSNATGSNTGGSLSRVQTIGTGGADGDHNHTGNTGNNGTHDHGGDTGPGTGSTNKLGYIALNYLVKT